MVGWKCQKNYKLQLNKGYFHKQVYMTWQKCLHSYCKVSWYQWSHVSRKKNDRKYLPLFMSLNSHICHHERLHLFQCVPKRHRWFLINIWIFIKLTHQVLWLKLKLQTSQIKPYIITHPVSKISQAENCIWLWNRKLLNFKSNLLIFLFQQPNFNANTKHDKVRSYYTIKVDCTNNLQIVQQ